MFIDQIVDKLIALGPVAGGAIAVASAVGTVGTALFVQALVYAAQGRSSGGLWRAIALAAVLFSVSFAVYWMYRPNVLRDATFIAGAWAPVSVGCSSDVTNIVFEPRYDPANGEPTLFVRPSSGLLWRYTFDSVDPSANVISVHSTEDPSYRIRYHVNGDQMTETDSHQDTTEYVRCGS